MNFEEKLRNISDNIYDSLKEVYSELKEKGLPLKRDSILEKSIIYHIDQAIGDLPCKFSKEDLQKYKDYVYDDFIKRMPFHILCLHDSFLGKFIRYWYALSVKHPITSQYDPIYVIAVMQYINDFLDTPEKFIERLNRERKAASQGTKQ